MPMILASVRQPNHFDLHVSFLCGAYDSKIYYQGSLNLAGLDLSWSSNYIVKRRFQSRENEYLMSMDHISKITCSAMSNPTKTFWYECSWIFKHRDKCEFLFVSKLTLSVLPRLTKFMRSRSLRNHLGL